MEGKKNSFIWEVLITVIVAVVAAVLLRCFVINPIEVSGASMNETLYGGVYKGLETDGDGNIVYYDENGQITNNGGSPRPVYEGCDVAVLYRQGGYKYSDIIVFDSNAFTGYGGGTEKTLIKRVIATGGQTVRIEKTDKRIRSTILSGVTTYVYGADVYVDDVLLEEEYLSEAMEFSFAWLVDNYSVDGETWSCSVPENSVFVMGDNRNNSSDSRMSGTVSLENKDYIAGRVIAVYNTTEGHRTFWFTKRSK